MTIIPGINVAFEHEKLIATFKKKFRFQPDDGYDNVPTSCYLQGHINPNAFNMPFFMNSKKVYMYFDFDNDLRILTPLDVIKYKSQLQEWEDYDFCVFDDSLEWCIGVTHNDQIIEAKAK